MELATTTESQLRRRCRPTHFAYTGWQLLSATAAVVAGFSTLNMTLADSGFAVLQQHAAPLTTMLSRLTRQG